MCEKVDGKLDLVGEGGLQEWVGDWGGVEQDGVCGVILSEGRPIEL